MSEIDPEKDGVDHINIYSKGKTELGRSLTNFAHTPFTHPRHGRFESMEGYWYWIKTGKQHEKLRRLYGFTAKLVGRELKTVENVKFEQEICEGLSCKIEQNEEILTHFLTSTLPFIHYYNYGGKVISPKSSEWQMEYLMKLREELKGQSK